MSRPIAIPTLVLAFALAAPAAAQEDAEPNAAPPAVESPDAVRERAAAAYDAADWATCTNLYDALAKRSGRGRDGAFYNAACCAALAGQTDRALDLLINAARAGWRDVEHVTADPDLDSLHDHPRWSSAVAAVQTAERDFAARVHPELYRMFTEDQADRRAQPSDWSVVTPRDEERRRRAAEILAAGEAEEAEDFFHAAILFQHGSETADYARAEELARKALQVDPRFDRGKWLIAAAHDRWLHSQDKPQIYGTQFKKSEDGRWSLDPIDPDAVTDAERDALGVPPLAEARRRAEAMNETAD
jgi:hypothetical protein